MSMEEKKNADLRRLMKQSGITYSRMAKILGWSESKLYMWFNKEWSERERSGFEELIRNCSGGVK